jgi:4-hydroxy-tetrahydrodipicolinate synthase
MTFAGAHTALVTPFRDGQFDVQAFRQLIEEQIAGGISGIVPVGTTGESPTLDHDEHLRVVETAVQTANKRCLVIAGTGSNATREAISLTRAAEKAGADAALLVAPYYNKPSQEGLYRHFKAIAESVQIPIVLYSIPGRCGIEIGVETTLRLASDFKNIVAIKEAGGSVERVNQLRNALPAGFQILSGDDSLTLPFMSVGAVGVISVASNIIPAVVADLVCHYLSGDSAKALEIHLKYYPLFKDLFIEPNPVPAKFALARLGKMSPDVRLPLCEMAHANVQRLTETLSRLGL